MYNRSISRSNALGRVALCVLGVFVLTSAAPAVAQTSANPSASLPLATTPPNKTLNDWRDGMARNQVPKQGCFTASYPDTTWQEVPCGPPSKIYYRPAQGSASPPVIGNTSADNAASVTGNISVAVGSFDSISGVTSETGGGAPNIFSLQVNSQTFTNPTTTSLCSGAKQPSVCVGFEQFVFSNSQAAASIEYWLKDYQNPCPTGWSSPDGGTDCAMSSNMVFLPGQATIAELGSLSLIGEAVANGNDTVILSTGAKLYAVASPDNILDLSQNWNTAEFNVFGDGNGTAAVFTGPSNITVRVAVDNGTPSAPTCVAKSFTSETNNLNFDTAPTAHPLKWPALVFTESTTGASSACTTDISVGSGELSDTHDFNGDGMSDLVWRDTSGDAAMWLMNAGQVAQSGGFTVPTTWSIVGQRDFQGVGKATLLWRDTSGDISMWQMNGVTVAGTASLGNLATNWTLYGTGDLNGDGTGDLLWRDTAGDLSAWLMSGSSVSSAVSLGNVPTTWTIVGDNNKGDIFWHDNSGNYAVWQMNGSQVVQSAGLGNVPLASWQIAGLGDFNGDGNTDILWRDTSGDTAIWFLNSSFGVQSTASLGNIATNWSVAQTGDYNGDGKTDIVWLDSAGDVAVWFMNGGSIASTAGLGNVGTTWALQSLNAE